jgi:beta-lactamase regulating signal transducer with metallopeptidase domain
MLAEVAWQLGVGAVLGWAALPLLVRLARRNRAAAPGAYYRTLVAALGIAAALSFTPLLRGLLGVGVELPLSLSAQPWGDMESITIVADWVSPLIGSRAEPWPTMPLARALSALGLLWLAVIAFGVVRLLAGRWTLARCYRDAPAAPARVLERAEPVARELGIAAPALRVAEGIASAFTFGVFSPVVVLGRSVCDASDDDLDFVLRHELTHVARRDAHAAFWIELAQRCFSGHPSLRALEREIRFAREAAVDEAAAGAQALEYARFLLGLAERVESLRAPQASLVSMADTALERRIEMLMSKKQGARSGRGAAWLGLSGLVLGALVFLAPSSFGQDHAGGGASRAKVKGNLTVAQIEQVVFGNPRPLLNCYARLPEPRDNLALRLVFEIAESGWVEAGRRVEVAQHPELAECFEVQLARYVFPAPSSGTVQVDMPVLLTPPLDERNARAEAKEGVSQRLAPEVIRKVVRDYYDGFRACYEELGHPLPDTWATMKFTIARDGKVSDGEVESPEHPSLGKCLDGVMRSMVFPPPQDGIVTVAYPLAFAPGEPEGSASKP